MAAQAGPKIIRLPPLPKISDILRMYGLSAKKQLSQNFILDLNVTDKIAKKADVFDCNVCEVGPGVGSLTRSLLRAGTRHVAAVEIDRRFTPSLEMLTEAAEGHLSIHYGDIMKFDPLSVLHKTTPVRWESDELPGARLVGNLPFAVSIPLLLQWLEALSERSGPFSLGRVPMCLVFQKEVGENLIAQAGSTERTRLSIMSQYLCEVRKKMLLPSSVFVPKPKVEAWLVQFTPVQIPKIEAPYKIVEQVVKAAFSMRRKIVRTPLRSLFPEKEHLADELLFRAEVDPNLRAQELRLRQFNRLCKTFIEIADEHSLSKTPIKVRSPKPVQEEELEAG